MVLDAISKMPPIPYFSTSDDDGETWTCSTENVADAIGLVSIDAPNHLYAVHHDHSAKFPSQCCSLYASVSLQNATAETVKYLKQVKQFIQRNCEPGHKFISFEADEGAPGLPECEGMILTTNVLASMIKHSVDQLKTFLCSSKSPLLLFLTGDEENENVENDGGDKNDQPFQQHGSGDGLVSGTVIRVTDEDMYKMVILHRDLHSVAWLGLLKHLSGEVAAMVRRMYWNTCTSALKMSKSTLMFLEEDATTFARLVPEPLGKISMWKCGVNYILQTDTQQAIYATCRDNWIGRWTSEEVPQKIGDVCSCGLMNWPSSLSSSSQRVNKSTTPSTADDYSDCITMEALIQADYMISDGFRQFVKKMYNGDLVRLIVVTKRHHVKRYGYYGLKSSIASTQTSATLQESSEEWDL